MMIGLAGGRREALELLEKVRTRFDHIVIDAPPQARAPQRTLLSVVDLALIPCGATHADLWSMSGTLEMVNAWVDTRPELDARIVLTKVDARRSLSTRVRDALGEVSIPLCEAYFSSEEIDKKSGRRRTRRPLSASMNSDA